MAIYSEGIIDHKTPCLNNQTIFGVNLKYAEDFMRAYYGTGFFGFMFLNEYSHDSNEKVPWIDDELLNFLKKFYYNKLLSSNTILILFSDHGARFSSIRKTIRGLLHERNPFFSIYLPNSFHKKYPDLGENLKNNQNKLVTPMDIHKTLMELLKLESGEDLDNSNSGREISIFRPISSNRSCSEAGIDMHWCACLKRSEIQVDSTMIQIGKLFVNYLNKIILKNHQDSCQKLELTEVNKIYVVNSYLSLSKKKIIQQNWSLFSRFLMQPKVEQDFERYFFQLRTAPNNAIYEFTANVEINLTSQNDIKEFLKNVKIDEKSISRINKYGNQSACIEIEFPDLRKYCYCKKIF